LIISSAKEKLKSRATDLADKLLGSVDDLVVRGADRAKETALAQIAPKVFAISFDSLAVMVASMLNAMKSMSGKSAVHVKSFCNYAKGTLAQYFRMLKVADAVDDVSYDVAEKLRNEIEDTVDMVVEIEDLRPKRKKLFRAGHSDQEIAAYVASKKAELIPELAFNFNNYLRETASVIVTAKAMINSTTKPS